MHTRLAVFFHHCCPFITYGYKPAGLIPEMFARPTVHAMLMWTEVPRYVAVFYTARLHHFQSCQSWRASRRPRKAMRSSLPSPLSQSLSDGLYQDYRLLQYIGQVVHSWVEHTHRVGRTRTQGKFHLCKLKRKQAQSLSFL